MNRTLVEFLKAMLWHRNIPKPFWSKALIVAAYVRKHATTRGSPHTTALLEIMFENKPNHSYLRVFGCRCWYAKKGSFTNKLDLEFQRRSWWAPSENVKGISYRTPLKTKWLVVLRHLKFEKMKNPTLTSFGEVSDGKERKEEEAQPSSCDLT